MSTNVCVLALGHEARLWIWSSECRDVFIAFEEHRLRLRLILRSQGLDLSRVWVLSGILEVCV